MNRIKRRTYYWDNLKGLLILFVVLGHLCEVYIETSRTMESIWVILYSFHMPLFIFINGYFAEKSKSPVENKIIKMFGIYLLMQILFKIGSVLLLKKSFNWEFLADPAYCCWYLIFLVYAYIAYKFIENKNTITWLICSFAASLLVGFDESVGHLYGIGRTFYFLPYFILGVIYAKQKERIKGNAKRLKYYFILFVMLIVVFCLGNAKWFNRKTFAGHKSYFDLYHENPLIGLAMKLVAYAIAIFIGYCILKITSEEKTIFAFFGRHTLIIYLTHIWIFKNVFGLVENLEFVDSVLINHLLILAILLLIEIICCIIVTYLHSYLIKYRGLKANTIGK